MTECMGSDCKGTGRTTDDVLICKKCKQSVCWWCVAHCRPTHICEGQSTEKPGSETPSNSEPTGTRPEEGTDAGPGEGE